MISKSIKKLLTGSLVILAVSTCWADDETVDLILVAGQSNAVGFDTQASQLPKNETDKKVMFWWRCGDPPADEYDSSCNQKWTTLRSQPKGKPKLPKTGKNYGNFKYDEGGFGPEIGLARTLLKLQPNRLLAIVKVAYSGTSISFWKPGNTMKAKRGANGYPAMMSEIKMSIDKAKANGITLRPRAFIWVQGESDAYNREGISEKYQASLEALIASLKKDLNAPELISLVGLNTKFGLKSAKDAEAPGSGVAKIVAAMKKTAAASPFVEYVDDWGCEVVNVAHFGSKGTLELGKRFAETLIKTEGLIKKSK